MHSARDSEDNAGLNRNPLGSCSALQPFLLSAFSAHPAERGTEGL
jgi:hypothetical protein